MDMSAGGSSAAKPADFGGGVRSRSDWFMFGKWQGPTLQLSAYAGKSLD